MKPENEGAETPFTFDETAKVEPGTGSGESEKEDAEDVVKV